VALAGKIRAKKQKSLSQAIGVLLARRAGSKSVAKRARAIRHRPRVQRGFAESAVRMAMDLARYRALASYPYFTYGSLMDAAIFTCVTRRAPQVRCPAWLEGQRRTRLANQSFPMVDDDADSRVFGLLLEPPGTEALARLHTYETADYLLVLRPVWTVEGVEDALVFEPSGRAAPGSETWHLADWQTASKPMVLWVQEEIDARLPLPRFDPWPEGKAPEEQQARFEHHMQQSDRLFDQLEALWHAQHSEASSAEFDALGHRPLNRLR
jgi:hypothetical protein